MRPFILSGLFGTILLTQAVRADGLIYQLPPDGMGARYELERTVTTNGQGRTAKGSYMISSVGTATVDGMKCRWIEIKDVNKSIDTGMEVIVIAKYLIPEEHLGRGKSPGEHVLRGWVKVGDREPLEIKEFPTKPQRLSNGAALFGPLANSKELENVEIDTTLGKLTCAGITGELEVRRPDNGAVAKYHFELRLHEKAPFGVVTSVSEYEGQVQSGITKLTLIDVNTTALSELPDRN